jgi:hypothetical protein
MSTHFGGSFDCDFTHKSFLPNAIEEYHIYSHKNGWFRHKSQMHLHLHKIYMQNVQLLTLTRTTLVYIHLSGKDENTNRFWYRMLVFNIFENFKTLPF